MTTDDTLERDLRRSLQLARKKRRPDTVKLRAIRSLVNDFQQSVTRVARAVDYSPETVRMIAAGEGPYKTLPDLGPERIRWLAEWMADYAAAGSGDATAMLREALASLPRLIKPPAKTGKGAAA